MCEVGEIQCVEKLCQVGVTSGRGVALENEDGGGKSREKFNYVGPKSTEGSSPEKKTRRMKALCEAGADVGIVNDVGQYVCEVGELQCVEKLCQVGVTSGRGVALENEDGGGKPREKINYVGLKVHSRAMNTAAHVAVRTPGKIPPPSG